MSITDEQLDNLNLSRLVEALERRSLVLLLAVRLRPEFNTSRESDVRQFQKFAKDNVIVGLGISTLLHQDTVEACRNHTMGTPVNS